MGPEFESLLAAAQAGGEWAFSLLYREYNPRLLRYFSARAPADADDLAAEAWMGVARQLPAFEGDETHFRSWLFTIAHRQLIQHWRKRSKRSEQEEAQDLRAPDDTETQVISGLAAKEAVRLIAATLSPEQAEVILLRVLGGLGVEQVARILGKRPGSVRALQHRAIKKLAAQNFLLEGVTR